MSFSVVIQSLHGEAVLQGIQSFVRGIDVQLRRERVTFSPKPMPRHVSKRRRRLRRQQEAFVARWRRQCDLSSAHHFKASTIFGSVARGTERCSE